MSKILNAMRVLFSRATITIPLEPKDTQRTVESCDTKLLNVRRPLHLLEPKLQEGIGGSNQNERRLQRVREFIINKSATESNENDKYKKILEELDDVVLNCKTVDDVLLHLSALEIETDFLNQVREEVEKILDIPSGYMYFTDENNVINLGLCGLKDFEDLPKGFHTISRDDNELIRFGIVLVSQGEPGEEFKELRALIHESIHLSEPLEEYLDPSNHKYFYSNLEEGHQVYKEYKLFLKLANSDSPVAEIIREKVENGYYEYMAMNTTLLSASDNELEEFNDKLWYLLQKTNPYSAQAKLFHKLCTLSSEKAVVELCNKNDSTLVKKAIGENKFNLIERLFLTWEDTAELAGKKTSTTCEDLTSKIALRILESGEDYKILDERTNHVTNKIVEECKKLKLNMYVLANLDNSKAKISNERITSLIEEYMDNGNQDVFDKRISLWLNNLADCR